MNTPRLFACILCAIAIAAAEAGCVSESSRPLPVLQPHTYAIVAVDDQGTLSQTELIRIEDSLVQFLLDQGYVRSTQTLIDDPAGADQVFRFDLSWNQERSSFAIVGVTPGIGEGDTPASPPPSYANAGPWPDDEWSGDPWLHDDGFGYAYGPYCPFLAVLPLFPYYGFDHPRRSSPPIAHHPPQEHRPTSGTHQPPWARNRNDVPTWTAGSGPRPPLASPGRPPPPPRNQRSAPPTRQDATVRPPPSTPQRRERAQLERANLPPAAMPARESAAPARFSPPPERSISQPSSRSVSPPPAPASSSSSSDSKSKPGDREK
jgi:hypothetical protein